MMLSLFVPDLNEVGRAKKAPSLAIRLRSSTVTLPHVDWTSIGGPWA